MSKSPIVGGFSTQRSPSASDSTLVNLGVEIVETKDGRVPGFLFLQSGLDLALTVGSGPIRGVLPIFGILYVVSGENVYSVTSTNVVTFLGTISDQPSLVSMFENGRQLMIVDGVGGWLVPGGYPLVGGTMASGGRLYALGDTITLKPTSGSQSSFPIIRITGIGQNTNGIITSYTFEEYGALFSFPTSFTQLSTSGAGSGFELTSPIFGGYQGIVPVTLPFPNPVKGGVSDGFGLLVFENQQYLAASAELDLSTWDALSFGVANQSPDNCVSLAIIHDEVFVLKENSAEVWIDEGNANFAFGPITSVHIEWGCAAPFSVAVANQELIWLSSNSQGQGIIVKAEGYNPIPISTQALVAEFDTYPTLGDAIAYVRQEGQHVYYEITFPQANKSWRYDLTTSALVGYPIWLQVGAFKQGVLNRHWGNVFTRWTGAGTASQVTTGYQAQSVTITKPTALETAGGLNGLPLTFSSFVFSVWIAIPDGGSSTGMVFGNFSQPGLRIEIHNDQVGPPEITVEAWDTLGNAIFFAAYDFVGWSDWVDIMISVDTETEQIQVYADDTQLFPVGLAWVSNNPISALASQPWLLTVL